MIYYNHYLPDNYIPSYSRPLYVHFMKATNEMSSGGWYPVGRLAGTPPHTIPNKKKKKKAYIQYDSTYYICI